jgi:hypothetical protein
MKLAGRSVSSFVRIDPEAYRTDAALAKWVRKGVKYALAASREQDRSRQAGMASADCHVS